MRFKSIEVFGEEIPHFVGEVHDVNRGDDKEVLRLLKEFLSLESVDEALVFLEGVQKLDELGLEVLFNTGVDIAHF